jgi:D-alanyl-D-alanine dipeptidase
MDLQDILQRPIPDLTELRRNKKGYRSYPILFGKHNDEPLVDIVEYGLAGQGYYSRHNRATIDPLPKVSEPVLVRLSVAQKLADINYELQISETVSKLFDGKVEVYLDEGYRSTEVQQQLYDEYFPQLLRKQYPNMSEHEIAAKRDTFIAAPSTSGSPAPHATGAAVDIKLRYCQEDSGYTAKGFVDMGQRDGKLSAIIQPDYFEHIGGLTKEQMKLQRNRRAFYWIMRGAMLDDDSGFECNPNEWWHWSYGDQLWAQLRDAPCAFYGAVEL